MYLATSSNLLLMLQDAPKCNFSTNSCQQKPDAKTLFFPHPPSTFPGSNICSEIGLEVMLRPLTTSCTKDYKGHLLVQTSFTEPPNTDEVVTMCGCVKDGFQFFVSADARSVRMLMTWYLMHQTNFVLNRRDLVCKRSVLFQQMPGVYKYQCHSKQVWFGV